MSVTAPIVEEKPGCAEGARSRVASFLGRVASLAISRRRERRLRLCEMLSLGEKRFVAVVEYGNEKFLLAGTPQNISLLKRLDSNGEDAQTESHKGAGPE